MGGQIVNRCAFAVIAAVLIASVASAFDPVDVTTLDGQTYKQVNSARIVGDKALLTCADGIASVSLKALSDGVREKLGIGALDALAAENKTLRAELKKKELRVAALEKENADLRAKLTGNAGTIPPQKTDEIKKAIAEHRLINGMTVSDAESAFGVKLNETKNSSDGTIYHAIATDKVCAYSGAQYSGTDYTIGIRDGVISYWESARYFIANGGMSYTIGPDGVARPNR